MSKPIELERAMVRYDSARAASPNHAEPHRQYATLASYFFLSAEAVQAWERALELDLGDSAAWEGYVNDLRVAGIYETDRRYSEKLLQILPDALRRAPDRPVIYQHAQEAASGLGQLGTYSAVLAEVQAVRPDDQILLHALGSLRIAVADQEGGNRGQVVRDSIGARPRRPCRPGPRGSRRCGAGSVSARGGIRLPHAPAGRRRGPLA